MTLKLVEALQKSLERSIEAPIEGADILEIAPPLEAEVIDFTVERARLRDIKVEEVKPETILQMALDDCKRYGNVTKAYITLILDTGDSFSTANYRAGTTREEEIALRQLGVTESIDTWRGLIPIDTGD